MKIFLKFSLVTSLFFSTFIFSELDDNQLALLEDLPPDQRANIEQKMKEQEKLTNQIEEAFEQESFLQDKSKLTNMSDDICEDCIYGYNIFKYAPSTFAPANNIPLSDNYVLGPGDKLEVIFYGNKNESIESYVNRNGFIVIPNLGPVNISGLTFQAANKLLSEKVQQEMIGVDVSLAALELRSITVFILGEAYKPGAYTLSALSTVTNALFQSGGVSKKGSLRNIKVKRNGEVVEDFDFYEILLKGNINSSNRLQDGDVIFIPVINSSINLYGSFNRTGRFELKEQEKLKEVITFGGGFKTYVQKPPILEVNTINFSSNKREIKYLKTEEEINNYLLRDGDTIAVTQLSELESKTILVEGEVRFPGAYSLKAGERALDVITRAGGYTNLAYPAGIIFTREAVAKREKELFNFKADELEDMMVDLTSASITLSQSNIADTEFPSVLNLVKKFREMEPVGRQVVNFNELDLKTDPFSNIILEDGDRIVVPKRSNNIYIIGEVQQNLTLRYVPGYQLQDYVDQAGGFTEAADFDKIFVIEPNGASKLMRTSIFGTNEGFLPGSVVVVTKDYNSVGGINFAKAIAPVVSSFATSLAALAVLTDR